jgi:hypothetical protein
MIELSNPEPTGAANPTVAAWQSWILQLAVAAVALSSLLGCVVYFASSGGADRLGTLLRPDSLALYGATGTSVQLRAYGIALLSLGVFTCVACLCGGPSVALRRGSLAASDTSRRVRYVEGFLVVCILATTLLWIKSLPPVGAIGGLFWGGHTSPECLRSAGVRL